MKNNSKDDVLELRDLFLSGRRVDFGIWDRIKTGGQMFGRFGLDQLAGFVLVLTVVSIRQSDKASAWWFGQLVFGLTLH